MSQNWANQAHTSYFRFTHIDASIAVCIHTSWVKWCYGFLLHVHVYRTGACMQIWHELIPGVCLLFDFSFKHYTSFFPLGMTPWSLHRMAVHVTDTSPEILEHTKWCKWRWHVARPCCTSHFHKCIINTHFTFYCFKCAKEDHFKMKSSAQRHSDSTKIPARHIQQ